MQSQELQIQVIKEQISRVLIFHMYIFTYLYSFYRYMIKECNETCTFLNISHLKTKVVSRFLQHNAWKASTENTQHLHKKITTGQSYS
jgi:hypothetical protein